VINGEVKLLNLFISVEYQTTKIHQYQFYEVNVNFTINGELLSNCSSYFTSSLASLAPSVWNYNNGGYLLFFNQGTTVLNQTIKIFDWRIYNTSMTQEMIVHIYQEGIVPSLPIAYNNSVC
jgi:hypothetical protein